MGHRNYNVSVTDQKDSVEGEISKATHEHLFSIKYWWYLQKYWMPWSDLRVHEESNSGELWWAYGSYWDWKLHIKDGSS